MAPFLLGHSIAFMQCYILLCTVHSIIGSVECTHILNCEAEASSTTDRL